MGGSKRPKLFDRGVSARAGARGPVWIAATYRVGNRPAQSVAVTDLSAEGCRIQAAALGATKSEPVELCLGDEPPILGRLRWIKQATIGIGFDTPLDAAALERLSLLQPDNVVPLRRTRLG